MSTSSPGSSKCHTCSSNTIYQDSSESCVACKEDKFAYPGDKTCRTKRPCTNEYDVVPSFSECLNDKRKVEYSLRRNSICNPKNLLIPPEESGIKCKVCQLGTYVETGIKKECIKCPNGKYSAKEDSMSCITCGRGYYAPKALLFKELEEFPREITTRCEQAEDAQVNPCALHKGWVVHNGSFKVPPHLPRGTILIMQLPIEIKRNFGHIEFVYELEEELKVAINGITTELTPTDFKVVSLKLREGNHTIEWIYKRKEETSKETRVMIHSINITGITKGSAHQCVKCPRGSISSGEVTECTPCPLGMKANEDSNFVIELLDSACEKCPKGLYKDSQEEICKKCPFHTQVSSDGIYCEPYDAYLIPNIYLFNLLMFDLNRTDHPIEFRNYKDQSLFGPYVDSKDGTSYFLSPRTPLAFSTNDYEYEEVSNGVKNGYIFGIILVEDEYKLISGNTPRRKIHYRLKLNLGSTISSANFDNWKKGEFIFEYTDGDICTEGERYSSRIKFVCNKSANFITNLEINNINGTLIK